MRTSQSRRRRPRAVEPDTVLRYYAVTLKPDADTAYDPVVVTLSYTDAEADALDPRSSRATNEAFKRAVKVERRTHHTPESRSFLVGDVRFVRQRLIVDAAAPRRRSRAASASRPLGRAA